MSSSQLGPKIFVHISLGLGESDDYNLILQGAEHSKSRSNSCLSKDTFRVEVKGLSPSLALIWCNVCSVKYAGFASVSSHLTFPVSIADVSCPVLCAWQPSRGVLVLPMYFRLCVALLEC